MPATFEDHMMSLADDLDRAGNVIRAGELRLHLAAIRQVLTEHNPAMSLPDALQALIDHAFPASVIIQIWEQANPCAVARKQQD